MEYLFASLAAFIAGFIDAVVGGGALIQIPALLILFPAYSPALLFGTNKFASAAGTVVAVRKYASAVQINWSALLPAAASAFLGSFLGARIVTLIDPKMLRPAIVLILILVAIYTFLKKDFGALHLPKLTPGKEKLYGVIAGGIIGFYDGFFGPGTGSFLVLLFVAVYGFNFLAASASAKLINLATNLSALAYFAFTANILYQYAVPMALCNIAGSYCGASLAIKKGSVFVRRFFLVIVSALILKLAYDLF